MAKNNLLIIVSGLPATGKTSLSKAIASRLGLPLVSKDMIKEILFDEIGHGDRQWGEKLNMPTYRLLNYFVEQELRSGRSIIVESPYDDDFPRDMYVQWQTQYTFQCVQILCYAKPEVLIGRFVDRIGSPDRHPGHNDSEALEDFKRSIQGAGKISPLPMDGEVYELDTTDYANIDTPTLIKNLEAQVEGRSPQDRLRVRLLADLWFTKKHR